MVRNVSFIGFDDFVSDYNDAVLPEHVSDCYGIKEQLWEEVQDNISEPYVLGIYKRVGCLYTRKHVDVMFRFSMERSEDNDNVVLVYGGMNDD